MIYGFEAAFFSSSFSNAFQASLALSNSFSASWTFFISALPSYNPGPFCASVVDLLFQVSQRHATYNILDIIIY